MKSESSWKLLSLIRCAQSLKLCTHKYSSTEFTLFWESNRQSRLKKGRPYINFSFDVEVIFDIKTLRYWSQWTLISKFFETIHFDIEVNERRYRCSISGPISKSKYRTSISKFPDFDIGIYLYRSQWYLYRSQWLSQWLRYWSLVLVTRVHSSSAFSLENAARHVYAAASESRGKQSFEKQIYLSDSLLNPFHYIRRFFWKLPYLSFNLPQLALRVPRTLQLRQLALPSQLSTTRSRPW